MMAMSTVGSDSRRPAAAIEDFVIGSTTYQKASQREQPSIRAASSASSGRNRR